MNNDNNNMVKNIEDLYATQFYKFEKKLKNGDRVTSMRMYGDNKDAPMYQQKMFWHFKKLRSKYMGAFEGYENDDWIQLYSYAFVEACYELKNLEPIRILEDEQSLMDARLSLIRDAINRVFISEANSTDVVVNTRDGKKYIEVQLDFLGAPMDDEQGDEGSSRQDYVTELDQLFSGDKVTEYNHFTNWVVNNYEDVLTKKQAQVFNELMECYAPLVDRTEETKEARKRMFEQLSISNTHLDRTFKAIKKRCVAAYNKEFGGKISPISEQSKKFHAMLHDYLDSADYPEWSTAEDRQEYLTKIVINNYDVEDFEVLAILPLSTEDKKNVVRAYKGKELITHRVLRLIKNNIQKYVNENNVIDITPSEVEYNYKEDLFADVSKMPGVRGRINHKGDLIYKDEQEDKWKPFRL